MYLLRFGLKIYATKIIDHKNKYVWVAKNIFENVDFHKTLVRMNSCGVWTRTSHRRAAQDESSTTQVRMPDLGVNPNENDPVMDNLSQEPEEFINREVNPDPVDGFVSQALLRVLKHVIRGQTDIGCNDPFSVASKIMVLRQWF